MERNSILCLMPWLHLHVSTRGLCQACCISPITFGDVNQQTLQEIWNGPTIRGFRLKMLNGEKDKRCNGCYKLEETGAKSIRQETLEKFSHHLNRVEATNEKGFVPDFRPTYLDIRFSNICNFRCITCWHGASSKWFEEAKTLGTNVADTAIIQAIDNEEQFFNQLHEIIDGVEEIYFAGGEPLVMEQHYHLLDQLLEKDLTHIHLRYNTNLSLLTFKDKNVLHYWKKFKHVTISASLDAAGELGEQIRRDSDWGIIKNNLRSIKERCPHVQLEIAPTISSLNVLAIPALHQELVDDQLISINAIYINLLERPLEYNIRQMDSKDNVVQTIHEYLHWLKKNKVSSATLKRIKEILNCLK